MSRHPITINCHTLTASSLLTLMLAGTAVAQDAPAQRSGLTIEEVAVTAQRRVERSQDVPMSIMAMNENKLEKIGFADLGDISDKIPTLSIQPDHESSSALKVYIRGIGQEKPANFERDSGVGVYLDDVYVGHGNGLAGELNEIERIEVLSGPQGILYGRNTVGGAVKFISKKPTGEFGFSQKLSVGDYGLFRSVSTVDLPEMGGVSTKLTMMKSQKDGWVRNSGSGGNPGEKDATGYRLAMQWNPHDDLTVDYVYDSSEQEGISNYQQHGYTMFAPNLTALQVFPKREDRTWRPMNLDLKDDFESSGHALTAEWAINEALTLKSISGYREFESVLLHDGAESYNVSTLLSRDANQRQFSQEFLLSGSNMNETVKFHTGVYYFTENVRQTNAELVSNYGIANNINTALANGDPIVGPQLSDLRARSTFDVRNKSKAIYGQITVNPDFWTRPLTIDVGVRYTEDDRYLSWRKPHFIGSDKELYTNMADSVGSHSVDPALTVDWAFTDDVHAYFRYAEGYRSGGFDSGNDRLEAYDPEKVKSYELGLKSKIWDSRLQFNMAVFKLKYKDIQVQFFDPGEFPDKPPATVTVNAAEASTKGAEFDLQFIPVENLMITAAAAYLESSTEVKNPFSGETGSRPLFNMPRWKYNVSAEYSFEPTSIGTWSALVTYDYRDEELAAGAQDVDDLKPDYKLIGARLTLSEIPVPSGELSLSLAGNNLTDEEYKVYHNYGAVIYGEPRNFSLNLNYRY